MKAQLIIIRHQIMRAPFILYKVTFGTLVSLAMMVTLASSVTQSSINLSSALKEKLKANLPELSIDQISPTQVPGVFEVNAKRKVFYIDSTARYAFIGNLVDLEKKINITQNKVESLNFIDWKELPKDLAITRAIGNGKTEIAIFIDPECPFCKRLEAETITKLNNVTIYYYLYPLAIHQEAYQDVQKILCAQNPQQALLDFMLEGKTLPSNIKCSNGKKVVKLLELAQDTLQLNSTPTLILPNGKIISGLVPANYLIQLINDNSK